MRSAREALLCAAALTASAPWSQAQGIEVEARVNAQRIGVEDVLELTVSVSGEGQGSVEPELPRLEAFRVAGRSTSSQFQIVNGQMSSTRSYIYQLVPREAGTFTIGAVRMTSGGRAYETEPIAIEVVAGSVLPRRPSRGGSLLDPLDPFDRASPLARRESPEIRPEDVYLTTEVEKRSVYLGEQVGIAYRLFSRYVPLGPEIEDDPPLAGFWVEEVERDDDKFERRTIDGQTYLTAVVRERVLFPTKAGTLTIPPLALSLAFRVSSGDPFDSFFARATRPVTIRSQAVELQVKPLPTAGRPRGFTGAVGDYRMEASLNKTEVEAGDAVTLTVSLEGGGNLRSVQAPGLPAPSGFRLFDPQTKESYRKSAGGLRGSKSWEYVLVPEFPGSKELGPWSFPFFDPEKGAYVSASAGPLELRVTGAASAGDASTGAPGANGRDRREVALLREDIRFLKEAPERLGAERPAFHRSPLFVVSLVLPVVWNLGLLAYTRRKQKERTHSHVFRSRRAQRMARGRLKRAARLLGEASRDFYEEASTALYRYVGDKLSVSPSGLTTDSIERGLAAKNVPKTLRDELLSVLASLEEARFTPGERTSTEMSTLRQRAERVIVSLEKHLSA